MFSWQYYFRTERPEKGRKKAGSNICYVLLAACGGGQNGGKNIKNFESLILRKPGRKQKKLEESWKEGDAIVYLPEKAPADPPKLSKQQLKKIIS